jgi:hypothetical protein
MNRSFSIVLLLIVLFSLSEIQSEAQLWKLRRYEAVVGIGPSLFFGDVGGFSHGENLLGFKDLSFQQTRMDFNVNLKYRVSSVFNARLSLTYGFLHATDERGSNEGRDFEASMSIFEPALIGEYYFIKNRAESSYLFTKGKGKGLNGFLSSLDFYVFAGIGGLSYSVKGNDKLVAYGFDNGGFTAVIPAGLGTTLVYTPNFNFGLELGARYAFSDYLDGYTSQYSNSNDVYYFLNFTIAYKLKTGANGLPSFR